MRFYFARHGESEANLARTFSNRDPWHPLTPRGREEALVLAGSLSGEGITAVYHSPAVRAQQTAEMVGRVLRLEPSLAEELREFDVGQWEGTDAAEGWAEWREVVDAWAAGDAARRVSNGESQTEITGRLSRWVTVAMAAHSPRDRILAVGHGGLYYAALPRLLENVDASVPASHPLGHCDLVVAEHDGAAFRCLRWGSLEVAPV